jgi:hypothetical protein
LKDLVKNPIVQGNAALLDEIKVLSSEDVPPIVYTSDVSVLVKVWVIRPKLWVTINEVWNTVKFPL